MADFFELVNRVRKGQSTPENETFKGWSKFQALRILSMNIPNVLGVAHLNQFTGLPLSNKQHYELLGVLPWDASYVKYIKGDVAKDKCLTELVELVAEVWKNSSVKPREIVDAIQHKLIMEDDLERMMIRTGTETKKRKKLMKYYKEKKV